MLFLSYLLSAITGLIIMMFDYKGIEVGAFFMVLVLLAKFGLSSAFNTVYVVHPRMFPTLFSVTSMGIANFASRFATIFAPFVAEVNPPTPMASFTFLCVVSCICTVFLREPPKKDTQIASSPTNNQ